MQDFPLLFQVRGKCLISYTDNSYFKNPSPTLERKPIVSRGVFTISAQKKLKKILSLWTYTNSSEVCNYSFITLTLSSFYKKDIKYDRLLFSLIEKLVYRYGKFNYVWRLEFQKNGNAHWHLLIDKSIDWKIVRGVWNKLQKIHVDDYQKKMQQKYNRGFYMDNEMIDFKGNIVEENIQRERYKKGEKANWRNPNSTDCKIINTAFESVEAYLSKYVSKNDSEVKSTDFNRFWGCNDELRLLKYCVVDECDFTIEEESLLKSSVIKVINDDCYRLLCTVYNRMNFEWLLEREAGVLSANREFIKHSVVGSSVLIEKDLKKYGKLFD